MKHLAEYILESLLYEAKGDDYDFTKEDMKKIIEMLKKLSNRNDLGEYVDQLNDMLKDPDAKNILKTAFGKSKKGYKFDGSMKDIPVQDLHPTQSEIDIKNSLGYPFENGLDEAKVNGERYYGTKPVSMPFPLIVFDKKGEKFILDGHHRWSQVYAFNKDASMVCLEIKLANDSDIKRLSATNMLKITQGFIAAKYAEQGKKELPKSTAKPENNIFNMDEKKIKEIVGTYVTEHKKEANILAKCAKLNSPEKFKDLLTENIMDLRDDNMKYISAAKKAGNSREFMPQTDKGGEGTKGKDNAKPNDEGSALNSMIKGKKASDKALKQEQH